MVKTELVNYDIYPKVFPCGKAVEVTIKPLGAHVAFNGEYTIQVKALNQGFWKRYPDRNNLSEYKVTPDENGCLKFTHTYMDEQEHHIEIVRDDNMLVRLNVYSLEADLCGRYPFRGDLHMHTCRSDGRQAPAIVAAEYRKNGYFNYRPRCLLRLT